MARQSRVPLLLTRPAPAAQRFAARIEALWPDLFAPMIAPLMAPVFFAPELPASLDQVIFTSETGVEALARLTETRGRAICVGPRTRDAATAAGWQAEVVGGDAEGLVRELTLAPRSGLWLHARGREAAGQMAARVREGGMNVQEAVVYAQEAQSLSPEARDLLAGQSAILAPVFSPRSGRIFATEAGRPKAPLLIAAISEAAAQAVAGLAPMALITAPTPDAEGMEEAIAQIIAQEGLTQI